MSPRPDENISNTDSLTYWSSTPATVNGMLGGYPQISRIDLKGSAAFLAKLRKQFPPSDSSSSPPLSSNNPTTPSSPTTNRAVDCGAGIGRITSSLLSLLYPTIDIVEPIPHFATTAQHTPMAGLGTIGTVYITGLESWHPEPRSYDLIWNQWCLGHLTDRQLVEYLRRCKGAVREEGWIVVKENLSTKVGEGGGGGGDGGERGVGEDVFDEVDSSVTRSHGKFLEIFKEAGVRILRTEVQRGFPRGLYPVRMYALRP